VGFSDNDVDHLEGSGRWLRVDVDDLPELGGTIANEVAKPLADLALMAHTLGRGDALSEEVRQLLRTDPPLDMNELVWRDEYVTEFESAAFSPDLGQLPVEQNPAEAHRKVSVVLRFWHRDPGGHGDGQAGCCRPRYLVLIQQDCVET
jgi:hypothetical protein